MNYLSFMFAYFAIYTIYGIEDVGAFWTTIIPPMVGKYIYTAMPVFGFNFYA